MQPSSGRTFQKCKKGNNVVVQLYNFLFYISETYGLMMDALLQPKLVAI